jgi:NitT/TauT family transport system permease protein
MNVMVKESPDPEFIRLQGAMEELNMGKKAGDNLVIIGKKLLMFLCFLGIWQLIVMIFHIKVFVLPSPLKVLESLLSPEIAPKYHWWRHIIATGEEIVLSFLVTAVVSIGLSILIVWSKVMNKLVMPLIVLFNSLPKIAMAPLFLMWFGYGLVPNILVAIMIAFFPVVINTTTGLQAVDEDLLDLVHYLNASKTQVFFKIRIPNSLSYIFAGLKMGATMCVVGAIVGEFVASDKGLGYLLRDAQAFIDTPTMFACLLLLSVMGLLFFSVIAALEKVCMPWNYREGEKENK